MTASMEMFDRFKRKGFAALRRGEYPQARLYLLEAVRCLTDAAAETTSERVRQGQLAIAREMLELARSLRGRRTERRGGADSSSLAASAALSVEEGRTTTDKWRVRERPRVTFDDIAGLEEAKTAIMLRMVYPFTHPDLAEKFRIRKGGGVLLYGPPGVGKTMLARAVAGEIDAAFFTVKPSEIMSKWVGEAEQNIAELFRQARAEPRAVIFIDEVEALIPRRRGHSSTVMQRVVPQILAELEGFDRTDDRPLLFIGATNEPWALDSAVMRPGRFDEKIYVPLPDPAARREILQMNLEGLPLAPDIDIDHLAERLEGYSGADIAHLCRKTADRVFLEVLTGDREREITMADLLTTLEGLRPSVSPEELAKFERFARGE